MTSDLGVAVACFAFEASNEDELSFGVGDIVEVGERS